MSAAHRFCLPLALVMLLAVLTAGCGEDGYTFRARNDSNSLVIVTFECSSLCLDVLKFTVPPKASGVTLSSLSGIWAGRVQVLDQACNVIWEDHVAGNSGATLIAANGTVTWSSGTARENDDGGTPSARPDITPTGDC
jgi:hypothetical protein